MPTLPHLLTLLAFLYILILNQTCHQKATDSTPIPSYSGVDVSLISCKVKNLLRIIFVVGDVKNTFLKNIPLSLNSFCVSGS